ncbi:hypothetical protein FOXG_20275 [Fusarium oxysporum f. sp. lycopersici 4287]|uniref:Uncharacterized protein n=2 Tax=Fusarium oxysporum TaxID=5507 RepID=A0A0J9VFY4_FUSO4|nr:hypothetical protein FOXG_20275 [Fusarium oxysporum f. sp. lycopersici 4287]XP_018247914.1 hypothetical protein FOXG_20275 [Fusarium oxysporum f. sp. lycopersici 4287]XP_018247915.1 hypothetical protein FOXG_20275 [Fusarium oxysporum f. sp. lycopersici 4287]XP_018247916.1 hypothetical protein FOXG_20275 [Fusarium oxysporum f. sp. lycopersici 4287]XP_018247917.1 hypothetical protein FOXG_20275 [Fusarium oxysporum f. sp. lycopersici 4287]EXK40040.1 hypothetical protein FOMG_07067 [Fusarium ox
MHSSTPPLQYQEQDWNRTYVIRASGQQCSVEGGCSGGWSSGSAKSGIMSTPGARAAVVFSVKLHGEAESSNITMQSNKAKWTKPKPVHDSTVSAIVGWQCVCVLCVCHRRCKLSKGRYGQSV